MEHFIKNKQDLAKRMTTEEKHEVSLSSKLHITLVTDRFTF